MTTLLEQLNSFSSLARRAQALRARQDTFSRVELDKLLSLARQLNECSGEEEALERLMHQAIRLVEADRGFLAEGNAQSFRITHGMDRDGFRMHRPEDQVSHSIIQQVLTSGQPLRSSNLSEMEDLAYSRSVIDLDLKSSLCVPLRRRDQVIGAICVDSTTTRVFTEHMLVLLDGFCELGSMTLAQLHLRMQEKERREHVAALERQHRQITNALPNALILFDKDGQILFGNLMFRESFQMLDYFQKSEDSPLGIRVSQQLATRLQNAAHQGQMSLELVTGKRSLRAWPFVVEQDNRNSQWGCVMADISIERLMQLDLMEREKISMTSRMAGSIAHEIRNALSPLVGHADLARLRLLQESHEHPELEADLDKVDEMANRIARIAENLRDLSRPMTHRPTMLDMNELIRNTLALMQETGGKIKFFQTVDLKREGSRPSERESFRIILDLDDNLQPLEVDKELLQQALMNLVINAAHAVEQQEQGRIHCRTRQRDDHLEIVIEDNGSGMDKETLDRIWEPYFTTKGDGGTGMGMPLIRMVMDSHKGSIDAESSPGHGSRFILNLPLIQPEKEAPA